MLCKEKNVTSLFIIYTVSIINTRKRFSEKLIVAFTNSTVFILDFYINMTKPVWSHVLGMSAWTLKKAHIISCQEA